jgi:hypothetical protein
MTEPLSSIADLRKSYERAELDEHASKPNPLDQFGQWLQEAIDAQVPEPNAMTLATVDAELRPSTRVVLIKGCDERGIVWYTNYDSRKGRELATQPLAALQFHWVELERVVRSMKATADEAGVAIVAGDTKVLERGSGDDDDGDPLSALRSAKDLYGWGQARLKEGRYVEAVAAFEDVLARFSGHDLADNSAYWIGHCHQRRGEHRRVADRRRRCRLPARPVAARDRHPALARILGPVGVGRDHARDRRRELGPQRVVALAARAAEREELVDDPFARFRGVEFEMLEGRAVDLVESAVDRRRAPRGLDVAADGEVGGIEVASALRSLERMRAHRPRSVSGASGAIGAAQWTRGTRLYPPATRHPSGCCASPFFKETCASYSTVPGAFRAVPGCTRSLPGTI